VHSVKLNRPTLATWAADGARVHWARGWRQAQAGWLQHDLGHLSVLGHLSDLGHLSQAQAGWLQHDLGHLSVFKSRELNLFCHRFVIIHLKAASSAWWNYRHYLHHAKPNIAEV